MDKKLIAAFTFGLLAVSAANVLLSVGIVSLLLTWNPGTDVQITDTGNFPGTLLATRNDVSLAGLNNRTMNTTASNAGMPAVNVTITPWTSTDRRPSAEMASSGQFATSSGQWPSSGEMPQGAVQQMPPSGQMPSATGQAPATGQIPAGSRQTTQAAQTSAGSGQGTSPGQLPSDTSQLTSGAGQYMSGTGSLPVNGMSSSMGIGDLSADLAGMFNGRTGTASSATATPKPELSFFNNMTSLIADQQQGT